jgi:hypothetical protein
MISHHKNMRSNNMTTSQHSSPLTTLHDKCQHENSNHLTTACYKNFMTKSYIHAVTEMIYALRQVLCVKRRINFLFTWFGEATLDMRRRAFPGIVLNILPQVRTNIDTHRNKQKTKVPNKESSMRNRTQQALMMTLQITDMLNMGWYL